MQEVTLKLSPNKARKLYANSSPDWKEVLEDSFPKGFFSQDITQRIKSFEDVCLEAGKDINKYQTLPVADDEEIVAMALKRLRLAYRVFQQDWVADYNNGNQEKCFPIFKWNGSGFGFSNSDSVYDISNTSVGLRLCLPPIKGLVEYVANLMIVEHNILLTQKIDI